MMKIYFELYVNSKKYWASYDKNIYWTLCKIFVILVQWMKLEFSQQIFEERSKIKFHENPSSGTELLQVDVRIERRTDIHSEANSRFPQFCKRAYKCNFYNNYRPNSTNFTVSFQPLCSFAPIKILAYEIQ